MIPKRKPAAANRQQRRATGTHVKTQKRGKPPTGPSPLVDAFKRIIVDNDATVVVSSGLMMGEKGWMFHREKEFTYAVTGGKTRVSLHAMPMYCDPKIHSKFKKLITNGDFGKGCIRFKPDAEVDVKLIAQFIRECAKS